MICELKFALYKRTKKGFRKLKDCVEYLSARKYETILENILHDYFKCTNDFETNFKMNEQTFQTYEKYLEYMIGIENNNALQMNEDDYAYKMYEIREITDKKELQEVKGLSRSGQRALHSFNIYAELYRFW